MPNQADLLKADKIARDAVALSHGTMFQQVAELHLGEVSRELNTARTLTELEQQELPNTDD